MPVPRRDRVAAALLLAVLLITGCNRNSTTSPTVTTTTTTTTSSTGATPTITDTFNAVLPVRGTIYFPFTVNEFGSVGATLASVSGAGVPTTVQLRLGLGTISDDSCATSAQALTKAGTAAQVNTTLTAGTWCVMVQDVGNLFAPATVRLSVLHP